MSQKCYSGENTAGGATEAVRQKAPLRDVREKGMADDPHGVGFFTFSWRQQQQQQADQQKNYLHRPGSTDLLLQHQ